MRQPLTIALAAALGLIPACHHHGLSGEADSGSTDAGTTPDAGATSDSGLLPIVWRPAAPCPVPRFEAMGAAVNGKLLVLGGFVSASLSTTPRVDLYDPATDTWQRMTDLPGLAQTHAGVAVDGPKVYVIGGLSQQGVEAETWIYDALTDSWAAGVPLPALRAAFALVRIGRTLHAIGGLAADGLSDSPDHTLFDLDAQTAWTYAAPLPNPRNHLGGGTAGSLVVVAGGRHGWDESAGNQVDTDTFEPDAGTWTRVADLPLGRSEIAAATFSIGGKIMVVGGGRNPATPTAEVDLYDPVANQWQSVTPLPGPRKGAVADIIGNQLVVTTGSPTGTAPAADTWVGCCLP
jgi:N-acetylneuraminic acid mutarotase